jgi:hypothetical protein
MVKRFGNMRTKFGNFLNEAMKTDKVISFSDDIRRIDVEAGEKMAEIFREHLVGRTVSFHTNNFLSETFKCNMSTSHNAIMNVEDVIYHRDSENQYCTPYLVRSSDRRRGVYFDISPRGRFFFIDTFMKEFEEYFGKKISFTGSRKGDDLSTFNLGNKKMIVKCVPTKIVIVHDAIHQSDLLKVYTDKDKEYYYIDFKKQVKLVGGINPLDPYGEEEWDND